jgi:hypothetical protein
MSEDVFNFSVCFYGVERKYLNGRGSGCPMFRTQGLYILILKWISRK